MTSYRTAKTYLTYYFNGELDSIIDRLRRRKNQKFSDDCYCTLSGVMLRPGKSSNKSGHADITAARAIHLADISLSKERNFKRYSDLKEDIKKEVEKYDQRDLALLKADLGLTEYTKTELIKASSFSYTKAKKRLNEIFKAFDPIVRRAFGDECD